MTRQGLKRIGCTDQCGAIAYMTLAQLERHGVPACPCGAPMYPEAIEVAASVLSREQMDRHPAWRSFWSETRKVQHGQAPHIQRGRDVLPPETIAHDRIERQQKTEAHARRLGGLRQYAIAAQAVEEMPF